ncbi:MAG TPA: globin domain-containing protein [Streptosporangiaceae bacterium]
MAIALHRGYPEELPLGRFAGQPRFAALRRRRETLPERLFSLADHYAQVPAALARQSSYERTEQENLETAADGAATGTSAEISELNARLVRESFSYVAANAEAAMEYFYARLFVHHPEIRSMFPHAMRDHMGRVFQALAHIVQNIGRPESLNSYLGQLGRHHRKFGVKGRHYEPFLAVLADTVRHFSGDDWTDETQAAWEAALARVSATMTAAADEDQQPSWWIGEVVRHDLRSPNLAVLTIRPDQPLPYWPGQYLAVQVPRWPRVWRNFSIANAPRENGLVDLHVRAIPGGLVSGSLVHSMQPGDTLLLGQAEGVMTAPADPDTDLLCVAGGTGLAPIKAIIESVIARGGRPRKIGLYLGARTEDDLYDLGELQALEAACPALTVIPVVSHQPNFSGIKGMVPDVVAQHLSCAGQEIFISGPGAMIRETARLLGNRADACRIRYDPPGAAG